MSADSARVADLIGRPPVRAFGAPPGDVDLQLRMSWSPRRGSVTKGR
jgi:hypothetical protein